MRTALCQYSFHRTWEKENWTLTRYLEETKGAGVEGLVGEGFGGFEEEEPIVWVLGCGWQDMGFEESDGLGGMAAAGDDMAGAGAAFAGEFAVAGCARGEAFFGAEILDGFAGCAGGPVQAVG